MIVFLSPHIPEELFTVPIEKLKEKPGYWRIDPEEYKKALLQRWEDIIFRDPPANFLLSWSLPIPETGGRSYHNLDDNTVVFNLYNTFEEYVLWHRSLIPEERHLYFFLEGIFIPFEIKLTTSAEELKHFVGAT
jgi:hypothetical protein